MDLSEYRDVFLEELQEQIQLMEKELLQLEQTDPSKADIQTLFRIAHTLKGSSATMRCHKIKELTHAMEQLLEKVRSGELAITEAFVDIMLNCLDQLKALKNEIAEWNEERSEVAPLIGQLLAYRPEDSKQGNGTGHEIGLSSSRKKNRIQTKHSLDVQVTLSDACEMKLVRASVIDYRIREMGEILYTAPPLQEELEDAAFKHIKWGVSTDVDVSKIRQVLTSLMDVEYVHFDTVQQPEEKQEERDERQTPVKEPTNAAKNQTIRVNVERVEHLMNMVGELVIEHTRIQEVNKRLNQEFAVHGALEELGEISDHLTRVVSELQEGVMKVRMLPIEHLFNRFPRMIRDLSQSLHKDVELLLEGKDTELDRTLIEEIGDPLIHLIRNAVDHGIEAPEAREQKGKQRKGRLQISAAHEDNQVVITVEDDGAGIDPKKMKQSAVKKGLISVLEAEQLNDHEAIQLIFSPGFSTAATVSDISGRGVGMDIVRNDIERLNGMIDIDTEIGRGTSFKIRLPLTLAIITGLMVKLSTHTYIIPMANIAEIVRVAKQEIHTVKGVPVITIRNQIIPVVWLHDHFGYPRSNLERKQISIVIVGRAEKRLALVVDELLGNQEVVIKSLGNYVGNVQGISGATILGDGKVALILEIGGIMKLTASN